MRKTSPFNSLCGRYFLEATKERNRKKNGTFFFSQQRKQGHLKQGSKGKQVSKRPGGKKVHPNVTASVLHILTF